MQCHGPLRRPLREIIKSIGVLPPPQLQSQRHSIITIPSHALPQYPRSAEHRQLRSTTRSHPAQQKASPGASFSTLTRSPALNPTSRDPLDTTNKSTDSPKKETGAQAEKVASFGAERGNQEADSASIGSKGKAPESSSAQIESGPGNRNILSPEDSEVLHADKGHGDSNGESNDSSGDIETMRFDPETKRDGSKKRSYKRKFHRSKLSKEQILKEAEKVWNERNLHRREDPKVWRDLLSLMSKYTPRGPDAHRRQMEYVRLPDGVCAEFVPSSSEAILELMRRTGSHAQMLEHEGESHRGITALSLWGTASQNAHAIQELPRLVRQMKPESEAMAEFDPFALSDNASTGDESPIRFYSAGIQTAQLDNKSSTKSNKYGHLIDADHQHRSDEAGNPEELKQSLNELLGTIEPDIELEQKRPAVRTVWSQSGARQTSAFQSICRRPTRWSANTFATYVEALTAPSSRLVQQKSKWEQPYDPQNHLELVTEELFLLFETSPLTTPHITVEAANNALRYFLRTGRYVRLRYIFNALERAPEYELDVSNFNILLSGAANDSSLANFHTIVQMMIKRGINPTWETWVYFHRLVSKRQHAGSASLVARRMRSIGLMANLSCLRAVAQNSAAAEYKFIADGRDLSVDEIFNWLDKRFGPDKLVLSPVHGTKQRIWMTTSVANKIIYNLLASGKTADAWRVLQILEEQGERADIVTLNAFLTAAAHGRDISSVMAVISMFKETPRRSRALEMDEVSFEILFNAAWETHHFNMLRVIWRYACINGHVSYGMQTRIRISLSAYLPETQAKKDVTSDMKGKITKQKEPLPKRTEWWKQLAGKFVVGVTQGLPASSSQLSGAIDVTSDESHPDEDSSATVDELCELLSQKHADKKERDARYPRTWAMILADFKNSSELSVELPFTDALQLAHTADCRWQKPLDIGSCPSTWPADQNDECDIEELYRNAFQKMIDNAVQVPVVNTLRRGVK